CLDVINWFKGQGCYVIGGVPTHWLPGNEDSRAGYLDVYHAFNMISPWMVGRISDVAGADHYYNNVNQQDQADCNAHGIDYQPCVIPGDLQSGHRAHGELMWRQFYNLCRVGVQGMYISMFDEYNEGNQIAKTAETAAWVPNGSGIRALNEDGTACSSDYYLRLTADGGKMLKGQIPITATRPTQPVLSQGAGVIFYQDVNYGGAAGQPLAKGNYTRAQLQAAGVQDNWASSARVPAGWSVTFFADDNFSGTSWTRTADTPNFIALSPNANDVLTSCRIQ
ncbi:MAG: hypothetical protein QOG10_6394, partial [Kribbellaceae bacterium]|nr:hypothetical protein [Kribbellaceae bacterium]